MDKFLEKTIFVEKIYKGRIIDLNIETVILPNGKEAKREVVRHPGAVAVLALTTDGKIIMVDQYRKALDRTIAEIPAGKLEKDEDPLQAALRELKEETGFTTDKIKPLVSFYTSPGFADEIIHLYIAHNCLPGERSPDEDEFVEARTFTLEEAYQFIHSQKIMDAKTIMAIYYWDLMSK